MGVGAGLYMYVVVGQKFTFAISSPDEFLFLTEIIGCDRLKFSYVYTPRNEIPCTPPPSGPFRATLCETDVRAAKRAFVDEILSLFATRCDV